MKIRQDNDVIDCIGAIYAVINTEVSQLTQPGAICDEN